MDLNTQSMSAERLAPNVRKLVELVADQLGMGEGAWRLEVEVQDGRVSSLWRHHKLPAKELDEWSLTWRAPDEPAA
jgi:hypothetical protein